MSTSPARLLAAIAESTGAAAVIAGPPGSGKSALLENLERRASAAGWLTRRAGGVSGAPYGSIQALFDSVPARLGSPAEIALSLYWECASIARHAPIALFLDDAQSADRESLKVLAQLARRTRTLPLLVVLATRPHEHETLFATVADPVRLERRLKHNEADSAWAGLESGALTADLCAVLARSALVHDPRSLKALRTLILTDRVAEAEEAIARLGDDPAAPQPPAEGPASSPGVGDSAAASAGAASRLAAELALRVGRRDVAEREARRALALRVGRRDLAEREARRALALGVDALDVLVDALIGRGATEEARFMLDGRAAPAGLLLAEGDFDGAAAAAREEGWRRTALGQTSPAGSAWRSTLALALAHAGQFEEAGVVADDEIALARAFGAPTPLARALHARCVAEPELEARAAFAEAVLATPTPATLLHAGARIELGIVQLRLGDRAGAREALELALVAAEAGDAHPMAARARRAFAASDGSLNLRHRDPSLVALDQPSAA